MPVLDAFRCLVAATDIANCDEDFFKVWQWLSEAGKCGVKRRTPPELSSLLKDQWIAVVGDSVGRMLFAAILRLLGGSGEY